MYDQSPAGGEDTISLEILRKFMWDENCLKFLTSEPIINSLSSYSG